MAKTVSELKFKLENVTKRLKWIEDEIAEYTARLKDLLKSDMSNLDDYTFNQIVNFGALIDSKQNEFNYSQVEMYTVRDTRIYTLRRERYLYEPLPENDDVLKLKGWDGMNAVAPKTLTRVGQDVSGRHVYQAEQGSLYVASKPFVIEWTSSIGIQDVRPISVEE